MSEHSWCQNIPRDEAVRAAEDNRTGPLPTLEECIERQKHAAMTAGVKEGFVKADGEWKRLTEDELRQILMIPKTVSASSAVEPENKGDSMRPPTTKTATVENDFAAVTERRSVQPGGGGNVTRLRTERVSLSLARMGELIDERDAAIRERDELRARVADLERAYSAECDARAQAHRELSDLSEAVRKRESGEECDHSYASQCREAAAARDRADRMMPAPAASGAAGEEVG